MRFSDLKFEPHIKASSLTVADADFGLYEGHTQAIYEDNGVKVSVLFGNQFQSDGKNTYEAMVTEIDGKEVATFPLRDLTKKQLVRFISKVCGK